VGGDGAEHRKLPFPHGAMQPSPNQRDVEIVVIGAAPWTINILSVESVDVENSVAVLGAPSSYRIARPHFGFGTSDPAIWVENTFAGLLRPGTG